jgi:hypothetical protein
VLVDLIGDHPDAVLERPAPDRLDLIRRVDRSGRVRRRAEQQHLGAIGPGRLQLGDRGQEAAGDVGLDRDDDPACEPDRLRVGRPVRRGQQHLVARVQQRGERLVDGLLATVRDQDLGGRDVVGGVAQRLLGDRLAQRRQPSRGGVVVHRRVAARGDRGGDDRIRGREVRLAGAEADDIAAGGLQRLGPGVHGERGRLGDGGDAGGDARGRGHAAIIGAAARACSAINGWFDRVSASTYTQAFTTHTGQ